MSWYKTGTVSLTNGNATVYGSGTAWVDAGVLNPGDIMPLPDGKLYEILSIQSNTQLTLASNYLGSTASGQSYAIMPIGLLPSALAQQVKSTLATANTALASAVRFDINNQGLTSTQQQNARTNVAALGAADVGQGAVSVSVAGNTNVTLNATQAAAEYLTLTGALTGNITVYTSATAKRTTVYNNTSGAYTVTFAAVGGNGVVVKQGLRSLVESDGTNIVWPVGCSGALDLNGASLTAGTLGVGSAASGALSQFESTSLKQIKITYSSVASYYLNTNSSGNLTVDKDGTLIGTFSPSAFFSAGNIGAGTAPSPGSSYKVIQGANGTVFGTQGDLASFCANAYLAGVGNWTYSANGTSAMYQQSAGQNYWYTAASGTAGNPITWVFQMQTNSTATSSGANAAASVLTLYKDTLTGRSATSAGTINASGADYAEYENNGGVAIRKGAVVGFKADGMLTLKCQDAIRFGIKSSNPSYVGGDVWGCEEAVGNRPQQPMANIPSYDGTPHPGDAPAAPVLQLPSQPERQPDEADETLVMRTAIWQQQCAAATAAHAAAIEQHASALSDWQAAFKAWQADNDKYEIAAALAETAYKAALAQYEKDLPIFEAKLEAERQRVDRVAYSGKVPVNVTGAAPGGYIVAADDGDGNIVGQFVADVSFEQYKRAVGRVNRILDDGRAEVAVIVH